MNSFDDRKGNEEKNFVHNEEVSFKVSARRNRLLGEWAAQQLRLKEKEVIAYAKAVVEVDFEEPGDGDVLRKIMHDFEEAGVRMDIRDIQEKLEQLTLIAKDQITSE
jgi:hypothetical protein